MAKLFISSRMQELAWERKVLVETLHFAGHTPLYFEREPRASDVKARLIMEEMIARSDVLLQIYYLSQGINQRHLDFLTPICYEFKTFREKNPNKPCILLKKKPAPGGLSQESSVKCPSKI
jgi:hypothetical protein